MGLGSESAAAPSSCIVLSKRRDLPVKWRGPRQRGQAGVSGRKGLLVSTLQRPGSFVRSGHPRVSRCGLLGSPSLNRAALGIFEELVTCVLASAIAAVDVGRRALGTSPNLTWC